MYFVYTLSYNGIVFYVGMTNNIVKRYIAHYLRVSSSTASDYCASVYNATGEYVDISVVFVAHCKGDAEKKEIDTINKFKAAGISLVNRINNKGNRMPIDSVLIPNFRFSKKIKTKLINLQNSYNTIYGN